MSHKFPFLLSIGSQKYNMAVILVKFVNNTKLFKYFNSFPAENPDLWTIVPHRKDKKSLSSDDKWMRKIQEALGP